MAEYHIYPAGTGTSFGNRIYGLTNVNNNALGLTSGDSLIIHDTHYEALILPTDGLRVISSNAVFDGSMSLNGNNTLNSSYAEALSSAWQLVDNDTGLNLWKKGHIGTWMLFVNDVWLEPMPTSINNNTEATIKAAIGINEWTITTTVNTDSMGGTIYVRLPVGTTPNNSDIRCSHSRRYNSTGSTTVMKGAIEAVGRTGIVFEESFLIKRVNNTAGHRVSGLYFEQNTGLTNEQGQFNIQQCYIPMRVAGGDSVKLKFQADYCSNAVAIQNSNEATGATFAKAGTIEIYDWVADHVAWFPKYAGGQGGGTGGTVEATNDQDGGVGIGYNGGDLAKIIVRDGVCRWGGPNTQVLKSGWTGTVAKGSGTVCSTSLPMVIDELQIKRNRYENVARTPIGISGTGLVVTKRVIEANFIKNTRGIPSATNNATSILSSMEQGTQTNPSQHIITDNVISGGTHSAAALYNAKINASSTLVAYNNIFADVTIESGYTNYGCMQLAQATNNTVSANIFSNSGNGVIGRIVNTNYTTGATFNTATGGTNTEGTVMVNADGSVVAGTANPIGTGYKHWGTNPRPSGINGQPKPDEGLDIGCYQSTLHPFHPVNL